MSVFFGKTTTPFTHNSGSQPFINVFLELIAAHREELRTVIECRIFDASRSQTTADTTTLIKNGYVMTMRDTLACRHETGKTCANNNDAHC